MEHEAPPHLDDDNPWPGLDAYEEASKDFFHGRDASSAELLRLIRQSVYITLYGKSGLGKSSMLKAGVFPPLRTAHYLPVHLRLDYSEAVDRSPLEQAMQRLLQEIKSADADASAPLEGEGLWAYLQRRERPIWTADNFPVTPVLVFDQFEEVFSRGGSSAHQEQMLNSIADLVGFRLSTPLAKDRDTNRRLNTDSPQYRTVLSFRSDFLAEVVGWERRVGLPQHESLELKAMTREQAVQAVERAGSAVLAPGVAAEIVDFVLARDDRAIAGPASDVEPALLSLCCYQLNNRRQRPAKIDSALLQKAGADILKSFYEEALHGMPPRVSVFIEDNLIVGGRYRGNFPRDEAISCGVLTEAELSALMSSRLLRVDPQGDVPRIELIHDRLVGVVRDARDARRAISRQQEEQYEAAQQAETERERERLRAVTRSRKHLIGVVVLLSVAFGLALAASIYAYDKSIKASTAEARAMALRLGVEAQGMLLGNVPGDDARAYQYLLIASKLWLDEQTEAPLLGALVARQHLSSFAPTVVHTEGDAVAVAFSPDGRLLAIGHDDGSLSLRDPLHPERVLARVTGHEEIIQSVAFSRDGQRLVSASEDGTARRWLVQPLAAEGEPLRGHEGAVYSAAFSPDGKRIVTGGADGTVRLWDAASGRLQVQAKPQTMGSIFGVAFHPDGSAVAAVTSAHGASKTGSLLVLDPSTLALKGAPYYAHSGDALALAFSASGRYVATGGEDDTVRVRDLSGDVSASVRMGGRGGNVQTVAFSPNDRWVASGAVDGAVRLWQAATGDQLGLSLSGHIGGVSTVAFSPDGNWLASGAQDSTLRLWPLDSSWAARGAATDAPRGARSAALAHDGRVTVLGYGNGGLWVRDDASTRMVAPAAPQPASSSAPLLPCQAAAEGDDKLPAAVRSSQRPTGPTDSRAVTALAIGPDGQTAYSGHADGTLSRWDLKTDQAVGVAVRVSGCALVALAISRDGSRLAAADSQGHVAITDPGGKMIERRLQASETSVTALALSADGLLLAVADGARNVQLFVSGQPRPSTLGGVLEATSSLDFSPDGSHLVVGSVAGKVRLWDLRTQRPVGAPLEASRDAVSAVAFSADGQRYHTVTRSGATRPWPAPATWATLMCKKLSSNLSRKQWLDWVSAELRYRCPCPGLPIGPDGSTAPQPEICPAAP